MMDPVVKKETAYVAAGTVILSVITQIVRAVFFTYDSSVLFGALLGGAIAVLDFLLLGITVNKAARDKDELLARRRLRAGYSMRLTMIAIGMMIAFAVPGIDWIMAVMSLLFPKITILIEPLFRKELKKGGKE